MPTFTNVATLTYNGTTTNSNIVTGELLATLRAAKTAVIDQYSANDSVTYIISIVNSGSAPFTGLTVTDNLGAYPFGNTTLYPLTYVPGSIQYYVNGVLQPDPAVTAGPPLTISGISVPPGGSVILLYQTTANQYAPLGIEDTIVNEAEISGGGLSTPITVTETIAARPAARLSITKALSPTVVMENGQLTYTFTIQNLGNSPATVSENVVLTDLFDPILDITSVTFNGILWTEGTHYTYNEATGLFATIPGRITVPAATYTQSSTGSWIISPGVSVLTVTGTI